VLTVAALLVALATGALHSISGSADGASRRSVGLVSRCLWA
jgi:hypothetical protein